MNEQVIINVDEDEMRVPKISIWFIQNIFNYQHVYSDNALNL